MGVIDFFPGANGDRNAFMAGRVAMIIDGSFAVESIRGGTRARWGVAPLPRWSVGGEPSNFGSYWVHGLTVRATGPKRDAAIKWLKFLVSEKVQRLTAQRQVLIDALNEVVVNHKLPMQALQEAAVREQKILDEFWA